MCLGATHTGEKTDQYETFENFLQLTLLCRSRMYVLTIYILELSMYSNLIFWYWCIVKR